MKMNSLSQMTDSINWRKQMNNTENQKERRKIVIEDADLDVQISIKYKENQEAYYEWAQTKAELKYILRNWDINPKWDDIIVNYCSPIDESQEGGRRQLIEWLSEIVAEIEPRAAIHTETKIVF